LLTPNLVFYSLFCGQAMLAIFCINRDHKISFLSHNFPLTRGFGLKFSVSLAILALVHLCMADFMNG
jgi:hypothetical protein